MASDQREQVRRALISLGVSANLVPGYKDAHLDALFNQGYRSVEALRLAKQSSLEEILLDGQAIVDAIMTAQGSAGPVAGAAAVICPDLSRSFCQKLLSTAITQPPRLSNLKDFLSSPPSDPLPIFDQYCSQLPAQFQRNFVATNSASALALAFTNSIFPCSFGPVSGGASKHMTILMESRHVVEPLLALDDAAGPTARIGLQLERDTGDSSSKMTVISSSGASLRPDGMFRDFDGVRVLAKWEDKEAGRFIEDAVKDIHRKTAVWTPLYYGAIEYLPCFVAAGSLVQFVAVPQGNPVPTPQRVSGRFDTSKVEDRIDLLFHCLQFYKLLMAQRSLYPSRVLPVDTDLVQHTEVEGFLEPIRRTIHFSSGDLVARKRVEPWGLMERLMGVKFRDIRSVYRDTANAPGLVHAKAGPALDGERYNVSVIPLGREGQYMRFDDEGAAQRMAHGLLHGLAAIHAAKFVFRDLRMENTACSVEDPPRWFLLDLECCAKAGKPAPRDLRTSCIPDVLVRGCFTAASDIALLGKLLWRLEDRVTSECGRQFLTLIHVPAERQQDARSLLQHPWISCAGERCNEAGARPGEH